jgi:hypothetical protein
MRARTPLSASPLYAPARLSPARLTLCAPARLSPLCGTLKCLSAVRARTPLRETYANGWA